MTHPPLQDIDSWVNFFGSVELPILRQTARRLEEARQNIDRIGGREIAAIVLQDPLMAVRVLSYIQPIHGKHLHSDITTIGSAVMMLGIEPFFAQFSSPVTIENTLSGEPKALLGILQVIRRAQRASHYANDWAFQRHDLNIEEVALAALLHDLPEILMWCFAPKQAIDIRSRLDADSTLRSVVAQEQVLGFSLFDLKKALCKAWQLPELINTLMDDESAEHPRVQNAVLAVNLARHSAKGWDNAALPDDLDAIEKLLRINRHTLLDRLDIPVDDHPRFLPTKTENPDED